MVPNGNWIYYATGHKTMPKHVCPTCRGPVPLEPPYWPVMNVFYCSQLCAPSGMRT